MNSSNGYISNASASLLRAILLNKVVVGKVYKSQGNAALTAPPAGYDSVGTDLFPCCFRY